MQKKGKLTSLLRALILTLVLLVVLLSFLALALPRFRVREVAVEGTSYYAEEEIIEALGIQSGDAVLEIDFDARAQNILAKCRYIKSILYSIHLSGRVVFLVEEETCLMYTKRGDKYYSFSDSLKVIEESDTPFAGFLYVELPYDITLKAGSTIVFRDSAVFAKNTIIPLVERLQNGDYGKQLTSVALAGEGSISFVLEERCKVILGEYKDLEEKEKLLKGILEKNGGIPEKEITINLSDPKNPFTSPGI